jgi:ABC-2 type transport system ATP-binding protein
MYAVETSGLSKEYSVGFWRRRAHRALENLSLTVEAGEIFGLLGPNGAGKTTTLKLLFRLVFPTSGWARILGKELNDIALHARVGFLPENPYFYDHLSAKEFLDYAAQLFSLSRDERRRRVGALLEQVGLAESRDVPLRKFSKGMVQRVGIAQALINDPEVIFLDEPMSGLDPLGRREVRDLVLRLKGQRKTVFFSTHILSDAETLCDRVAILDRGRLQGCGELSNILRLGISATEILLEEPAPAVLAALAPLISSEVRTGERVRVEITSESAVPKALQIALQHNTKVVSMNPVKKSLEDYFLAQVAASKKKLVEESENHLTVGSEKQ